MTTGILNGIVHYNSSPYNLTSKMIMILNLIFSLQRSLEQMRILEAFSPIVTMLGGVLGEFQDFLLFFFILVTFLSMGLSVLQIDDPRISEQYLSDIKAAGGFGYAGSEYKYLWGSVRNWIVMLRISTGDFNILGSLNYLDAPYNQLFWAFWTLCILICTIIFLNFVITKACAAYEKIAERLTEFI